MSSLTSCLRLAVSTMTRTSFPSNCLPVQSLFYLKRTLRKFRQAPSRIHLATRKPCMVTKLTLIMSTTMRRRQRRKLQHTPLLQRPPTVMRSLMVKIQWTILTTTNTMPTRWPLRTISEYVWIVKQVRSAHLTLATFVCHL